jgi:hypothetical protein
MSTPKMTPEEKARADGYAAGVAGERDHTTRALAEREERLEALVKLAMEAHDRTYTVTFARAAQRATFARELRERMAQAAQVWTCEVEEGRETCPPCPTCGCDRFCGPCSEEGA